MNSSKGNSVNKALKVTAPCGTCHGTGRIPASIVGPLLRAERIRRGIKTGDLARAMGISNTYRYDLEYSKRTLTAELLATYLNALRRLTHG